MTLLSLVQGVYGALSSRQKRQFLLLQLLLLAVSILELAGVSSIIPFIAIASDAEVINSNPYLVEVDNYLGGVTHFQFVLLSGCVFLAVTFLAALSQLVSLFYLHRFSLSVGGALSVDLHRKYLRQSLLFHSQNNSSYIISDIMTQPNRVSQLILVPLMRLIAKGIIIIVFVSFLLYINFLLTLVFVAFLSVLYVLVFSLSRSSLLQNGKKVGAMNAERLKLLQDCYRGIREVKLVGLEQIYSSKYRDRTETYSRSFSNNLIVSQSPSYVVEFLVVAAVVVATLFSLRDENLVDVLPLLAAYVLAAYKLVPAFQQCFNAVSTMVGATDAMVRLQKGLALDVPSLSHAGDSQRFRTALSVSSYLVRLERVSFSYPNSSSLIFEDVTFEVAKGETVIITGESGVGKSTLLDLVIGILVPIDGGLVVGGEALTPEVLDSWQKCIGYVPQNVHLVDQSIAENIAIGCDLADIDMEWVKELCNVVCLEDLVCRVDGGVMSRVGENGALLSGGQKQRIAIARALYRKPLVLVMDEGTASLDSQTEERLMKSIRSKITQLTIVMVAHSHLSPRYADKNLKVSGGAVIAE